MRSNCSEAARTRAPSSAAAFLSLLFAAVLVIYIILGILYESFIHPLTILSGLVVCWHFELLPQWMLALLLVREVGTLLLARWGLSHGVDIEVNWFGRVAVFPVMTALFLALIWDSWVPTVLLAIGIVLGVIATYLYARVGRDQVHAKQAGNKPEESAQP